MDLSPSKRVVAKRLSLIYLLFIGGVGFLSLDLFRTYSETEVEDFTNFKLFKSLESLIRRGHVKLSLCFLIFALILIPQLMRVFRKYISSLQHTQGNLRSLNFVLLAFYRPEQEAELTRLGQTLMHVSRLTWIIVEDYTIVTNRLKLILQKFPSLNIVLMAGITEKKYKYDIVLLERRNITSLIFV